MENNHALPPDCELVADVVAPCMECGQRNRLPQVIMRRIDAGKREIAPGQWLFCSPTCEKRVTERVGVAFVAELQHVGWWTVGTQG